MTRTQATSGGSSGGGVSITVSDTSSIDLTYSAGNISGVVLPAGVDHDQLLNYVANEHIDWTASSAGTIHVSNIPVASIDHDSLLNTHNLTTDIDHDALTNYVANEHIDWTSASAGTIDVTNIPDNFLRNDGDDTTTGIITAKGHIVNNTTAGYTTSLFKASDQITLSGNDFATNHSVYEADIDYVASTNLSFLTIKGIYINMKFSGSGIIANNSKLAEFVLDGNSDAILPDQPFRITVQNVKSGQGWTEGVFSVDAYGSGTGDNIATYTRMRLVGSGNALGYRGYSTNSGTVTGGMIGVQGYVFGVTGSSGVSEAVAIDGIMLGTGTNIPYNKAMGLRSNAHVLIQGARSSLIITNSAVATPSAVTTTHLNFANNGGELYVKGNAEFDGTVYMDGNLILPVKTDTGDPSSPVEGQIYVNTSDNKVRVYADASWRDLAVW